MDAVLIRPKLYIWKNSRLFVGLNHQPFRRYTLAWSQLLVSVKGSMKVKLEDGSVVETRSCMLKAGGVVNQVDIDTRDAIIAIYYFNPISQDFYILEQQMQRAKKYICFQHPEESNLVQQLQTILLETYSASETYRLMDAVLLPEHLKGVTVKEFDPRILETLQKIRETISQNVSVSCYAEEVHLSESRLNKLFKNQIGIPITKYRLQLRLSIGVILLAAGYSVTDAAYEAGFSSSAHFSRCFSDMIGVQPSTPFLKPPFVEAFISDDVLNVIKKTSVN